ncbi:HD domain-containing protein [Murimonas intestini]|uniref:HD domain-containing protein n=1 Tax=Murimonas intestini TaxID=1337051 RepID=A0AB73T244_9FIRM|nr:HD domain-containing protein [Murimonas intestini]MCR1842664.1 HD domain-containing protein [Murimonas intestini]MCR1867289.1 HD domain-containing protein [Murimonas intestini]MCR1884475.1 HD domain-containing protein [Murimonas intestini]
MMDRTTYELIENYMLSWMKDSAHDKDHIYRVLYNALDIASGEEMVDYDVLVCACLLHDIGRQEQFEDPGLCHAEEGAKKAFNFLAANGFSEEFARKVSSCIRAHRYRSDSRPESIEAKILYDADKIDVTGAVGIARTIFYGGQLSEPLYTVSPDGVVSDGSEDKEPSFFQEYKYKLEGLYTKFYTARGTQIASERRDAAVSFYESMLKEVRDSYSTGSRIFKDLIDGQSEGQSNM